MIVSIRGRLLNKNAHSIIVDVHGLGYECAITTNTYDVLPGLNEQVELLTFFHVTENGQWLYGLAIKLKNIFLRCSSQFPESDQKQQLHCCLQYHRKSLSVVLLQVK